MKFDYTILNYMNSEEILSLLKSNRFNWITRKNIKISLCNAKINKLIPTIGTVIVTSIVIDILKDIQKGEINEK